MNDSNSTTTTPLQGLWYIIIGWQEHKVACHEQGMCQGGAHWLLRCAAGDPAGPPLPSSQRALQPGWRPSLRQALACCGRRAPATSASSPPSPVLMRIFISHGSVTEPLQCMQYEGARELCSKILDGRDNSCLAGEENVLRAHLLLHCLSLAVFLLMGCLSGPLLCCSSFLLCLLHIELET